MTLDEAMKRIAALEREVSVLRHHWQPPRFYEDHPGFWVFLDHYEIANLRSAIEAIGYQGPGQSNPGPLSVLNSGDWLGQIYLKLPRVSHDPNLSASGYREQASSWKSYE